MTPIYQSAMATIYCADAMDVLPGFATESFDLIVTDPPYGVAWQSNMRAETFEQLVNDGSGDRDIVRDIVTQCVRLVGQNRHLYIFGPKDVLEGQKVSAITPLVWDKGRPGMGDLTSPWGPAHEDISFTTSKHRHAGQSGKEGLPNRVRKGSVLRFSPPTGRTVRHPSEKPVDLLQELIESSSRRSEVVLDPFAGIGSTGVAAILSGRRAVMVECERRYVDIAIERVQAAEKIAQMASAA